MEMVLCNLCNTLTDQGKEYSNLFSEKRAIIRKNRARQNQLAKKQQALDGVLD